MAGAEVRKVTGEAPRALMGGWLLLGEREPLEDSEQ